MKLTRTPLQTPATIQADFDRLAAFDDGGWTHNSHYHPFLMRHMPPHCQHALEIGCGTGTFSRLMASQSQQVLALDLSPEMIRLARERSAAFPNLIYQVADFMTWDAVPDNSYDCIASVATLHHLPLATALGKMARLLKPGGVLLILDLYEKKTMADLAYLALGFPVSRVFRWLKARWVKPSQTEGAAWQAHGDTDVYPTLAQVRAAFPGADVRRHLLFRFSLVWQKPA